MAEQLDVLDALDAPRTITEIADFADHLAPTLPLPAADRAPTRSSRHRRALTGLTELPRGVRLALATLFLVNGATYVAFPLLAVKLTRVDHLPAARVGTVLTVFLLAARLLPMLAGPLADRYDPRAVMILGTAARGVGFLGLGLAHDPTLFLVSAFFAGAGAVFEPPVSGLLAAQPEPVRSRAFALENAVLNGSVIGGPAVAALLLRLGPTTPFVCSAALFAVITVVILGIDAPRSGGGENAAAVTGRPSALTHAKTTLKNRRFVLFWVLMLPWFFLYTQLGVAIPVRSDAVGGVGWIGVVYAVIGVAGLAYIPFVKALQARIGAWRTAALGYAIVTAGLGLVAAGDSKWWLLACVGCYMLGDTMVLFASQMILAGFADQTTRASYFGIYAGSWALGGTAGNYVGLAATAQPLTPTAWLLFAAVGAVGATAFAAVFARGGRPATRASRS